jgi:hypothetical protein
MHPFWHDVRHNLRSAINTPLRHPHLLVYPIAAMVLLVPSAYMTFAAVVTGLFAWSVLSVAGNHKRLNNVLNWLKRLYFHGLLWVVSLLVIVLAACRFFDVSYVATITNSASSLTLFWFLLSIYVTLWYYEYWVGQEMGEQLLELFCPGQPVHRPLPYRIQPDFQENQTVHAEGRCLQVHGTRFVVVGTFGDTSRHGQAWEFYDQVDMFDAIATKQPDAHTTSRDESQVLCKPRDPDIIDRTYGLSNLRQRVQVYHVVLDGLAAAVLILFFWARTVPHTVPELTETTKAEKGFVLADHLFQPRQEEQGAAEQPKASRSAPLR